MKSTASLRRTQSWTVPTSVLAVQARPRRPPEIRQGSIVVYRHASGSNGMTHRETSGCREQRQYALLPPQRLSRTRGDHSRGYKTHLMGCRLGDRCREGQWHGHLLVRDLRMADRGPHCLSPALTCRSMCQAPARSRLLVELCCYSIFGRQSKLSAPLISIPR